MSKWAYYNDNDPFVCAWVRELIKAGAIPDGVVDERGIADVQTDDLRGFAQVHLFCGIAGWAYALRLAGWDESRQVWSCSAPCQPFSVAGKKKGVQDERHLWPEAARLIRECRPEAVLGEQVWAAVGTVSSQAQGQAAWIDLVQGDLEGCGYRFGACGLGAHSAGAPHIRQRLYWVADRGRGEGGVAHAQHAIGRAECDGVRDAYGRDGFRGRGDAGGLAHDPLNRRREERAVTGGDVAGSGAEGRGAGFVPGGASDDSSGGLADAHGGNAGAEREQRCGEHGLIAPDAGASGLVVAAGEQAGVPGQSRESRGAVVSRMVLPDGAGSLPWRTPATPARHGSAVDAAGGVSNGRLGHADHTRPQGRCVSGDRPDELVTRAGGLVSGAWGDVAWLPCRDGKYRPVESIPEQVANELPADLGYVRDGDRYTLSPLIQKGKNRVGRLRGYGNAVVAELAAEFVRAYMDVRDDEDNEGDNAI